MKRTLLSTLLFIGFSSLFAQSPGSGSTLTFDGINDYVNISNTAALNPTSAITVEAWIKADTWGINPWSNSIINKEGWALGPQGYTLRCGQNGRLSFNFGNAGVWHEVVSTPQMSTNRWYHVVGTYNGSVMQIYINGQLVGTTNYSGSIAVGTYDVRIGEIAYTAAGSRLFDGQIDEVRIWNQALSNTTIRNWMCKKVDNTHPNYANLAGYWRMDDGAGTTLSGSAGTPLNGTLVNGPTWATSSAPIGDESVYKYGAMIPLGLAHPDGDSLSIDTITGSPSAIHIYRVDEEPNVTAPPSGFNLVDSTRYWGVFAVGGTNPSFDVTYHYSGNPMVTAACGLGMARRSNNASINWADAGAIELPAMSQLYVNNTTPGEFILSTQALTVNVTAQGALTFCQGDSVTLNGSIGPSATYQWRLNGADIIGATDSVITVNVSGAYSLAVSDQGCADTSSQVNVVVNPIPTVQFDTINPVCLNASPVILNTGMPAGGIYSGMGTSNGFFDPAIADTGIHSLTYIFTDGNGCTDSAYRNIQVLTLPAVSLDTLAGVCEGAPAIQLSGGLPLGGMYSGPGVNNNQFDPLVSGAGTFPIGYVITGTNGCMNVASQTIEVFAAPAINAGPDKTTCPENSVTLVASGGISYIWSSGDSTQSTTVFPVGDSTFLVTGLDVNGCSNTDEVTVTILPSPIADAGPDQTICEGDTAFLLASGGTMYLWNTGQNTSNLEVQPNDTTSYEVIVTDASGCVAKDSVTVNVDPLPVADAGYNFINTWEVDFENYSTNGNSYIWDFGDGTSETTENPVHEYIFSGTFEVTLIAFNDCGTDTFTFYLNTIAQSIGQTLSGPKISLYPNPTSGYIQIEISQATHEQMSLEILKLNGQKVWEEKLNYHLETFIHPINLENLASGLYFLHVRGEKFTLTEKIILH